jgi:hypothetical protein
VAAGNPRRCQGAAIEDAVDPDLLVALAGMPDPRKSRGVRHRLVTVPGAAVRGVRRSA